MRIALGCDHAGFALKEKVKEHLAGTGVQVQDVGTHSSERVDYPDYAEKVGTAVCHGEADRGILVCGTGLGACIAANKIRGIRAASVWTKELARLSRAHNDANVLCLSGWYMDISLARELVDIFLDTPFEGGRHQRRLDKISDLEKHDP